MTYGEEVRERVERLLTMPSPDGGQMLTRHDRLVAAMCAYMAEEWRDGEVSEAVDLHLRRVSQDADDEQWETALISAQRIADFDAEREPEDGDVLGRWPPDAWQNG